MTNHRQTIPISRKLFSLLDKIDEVGQVPCRNFPDSFYPEGGEIKRREETQIAKSLCQTCPIIDDCRKYALEEKEEFGIWGGLDPEERRNFLKTISSRRIL
jgi:WhiB family redox-sensing transcriptional regulator